MFERTTRLGVKIAVGSGVPQDWAPGHRPRKVAAKDAKPVPKTHKPEPTPPLTPEPTPEPTPAPVVKPTLGHAPGKG